MRRIVAGLLLAALAAGSASALPQVLSPMNTDGINDSITFSTDVSAVTITDARGRVVFNRTCGWCQTITWAGRDENGQWCESGLYIVRITGWNGDVSFHAVALVK